MGITKIGLSLASKLSHVTAKYTGKALKYVRNVEGVSVTTYAKTGTKVLQNVDGQGTKSIELGMGNKLRSELGIKNIVSYPKGSFFGGREGMIYVPGANNHGMAFEPKEFTDYIKFLKELSQETKGIK